MSPPPPSCRISAAYQRPSPNGSSTMAISHMYHSEPPMNFSILTPQPPPPPSPMGSLGSSFKLSCACTYPRCVQMRPTKWICLEYVLDSLQPRSAAQLLGLKQGAWLRDNAIAEGGMCLGRVPSSSGVLSSQKKNHLCTPECM